MHPVTIRLPHPRQQRMRTISLSTARVSMTPILPPQAGHVFNSHASPPRMLPS